MIFGGFQTLDFDAFEPRTREAAEGGKGAFGETELDGRDGAGQIGAVKAWKTLTAWLREQGRSWSDFWQFSATGF